MHLLLMVARASYCYCFVIMLLNMGVVIFIRIKGGYLISLLKFVTGGLWKYKVQAFQYSSPKSSCMQQFLNPNNIGLSAEFFSDGMYERTMMDRNLLFRMY